MPYSTIAKFFIFVGVCLILGGVYSYERTSSLIERAISVDGVVARMERTESGTFRPIVEFVDHQDIQRTLYSSASTNPPSFFEGEQVTVIYDPNDPKYPVNARINATMSLWGLAIFLVCFGLFFILVSLASWYISSKGGVIYFDRGPRAEPATDEDNPLR